MAPTPWRPDPVVHEAGLRHLREDMAARGLNASSLARLAFMDHRMIGAVLTGKRIGSSATHDAIATAMGRCPGYYFPRNALELSRAEFFATTTTAQTDPPVSVDCECG